MKELAPRIAAALLLLLTPAAAAAADPAADAPAAATGSEPAAEKKSGCGSFLGGGLIALVSVLGSAWIAKRK